MPTVHPWLTSYIWQRGSRCWCHAVLSLVVGSPCCLLCKASDQEDIVARFVAFLRLDYREAVGRAIHSMQLTCLLPLASPGSLWDAWGFLCFCHFTGIRSCVTADAILR